MSDIQADILSRSGLAHTVSEAAYILAMTRWELHDMVMAGSVLGVMRGKELIIPSIQFVARGGRWALTDGMIEVVRLFRAEKAGEWSALQWLTEPDPNLGGDVPMSLLKAGETRRVAEAARAFLS